MIETARQHYQGRSDAPESDVSVSISVPIERAVYLAWKEARDLPYQQPQGFIIGQTIHADINWGRWVVRCCWCGSAIVGDPTDPRFACGACMNDGGQWAWMRVQYPVDRVEIERMLMPRPPKRRNWKPGEEFVISVGWVGKRETVADLLVENIEHADEIAAAEKNMPKLPDGFLTTIGNL
jgi:hypothetical protein